MSQQNSYLNDFVKINDSLVTGKPVETKEAKTIRIKRKEAIEFDVNGEIKQMFISQSLIHRLLFKGTERTDVCPRNLLKTYITRDMFSPDSDAMLYGRYFETKCIGSGADEMVLDLPRNAINGKRRVDHDRIDKAIEKFEYVKQTCGLIIEKRNVQIPLSKPWVDPEKKNQPSFPVFITGTADLVSSFGSKLHGIEEQIYCIDLKLTTDREQCYWDKEKPWQTFAWGCIETMDHIQGVMYSMLSDLPFMYLVFDYKPKGGNADWKPVLVKTIVSHPNDNESKIRQKEMEQSIRWTIGKLQMFHEEGWQPYQCDACKKCPVESCPFKYIVKPI